MDENEPSQIIDVSTLSSKRAILIGAIVSAVLYFLPVVNFCCCLGMLAGGFVTVAIFTSGHGVTISAGKGITLAIIATILGGLASWALTSILVVLGLDPTTAIVESFLVWIQENAPPESQKQIEDALKMMSQQNGASMVINIISSLVMGLVFSAIGGLISGSIGASMFKKGPMAQ